MSNQTTISRLKSEITTSLVLANKLLVQLSIYSGYAYLYSLTDKDRRNRNLLYLYVIVLEMYMSWDETKFPLEISCISTLLSNMQQIYKTSCVELDTDSVPQIDGINSQSIFGTYTLPPTVVVPNTSVSVASLGIAVTTTTGAFGILSIGQGTYTHSSLKGQNIQIIFVNNIPEFKISGQFTFDPVSGTIDRSPNIWDVGDTLVII